MARSSVVVWVWYEQERSKGARAMRNWLKCVGTARGRSDWMNPVDQLEPRVLLTGASEASEFYSGNWRGMSYQMVRDSWVLTFDHALGRDAARASAQQVAQSMGLQVESIDVTVRGRFANIKTRTAVTENAVDGAKARFGFLKQVEPEYVRLTAIAPNDARYPEQWALNNTGQPEIDSGTGQNTPGLPGADLDLERAWNISTGSDRVVIVVIDSGVDIRHPDLAANIWTNPGEIPGNNVDDDGNGLVDDINGYDFAGNGAGQPADADPSDDVDPGHGTAVAGTIGAVGGNGIGVSGTAWNISIMAIKIGAGGPAFGGFAILQAYDYITQLKTEYGINIVASNNSYGALAPDDFDNFDSAEETGILDTTAAGILFVAAAGNDSLDNDSQLAAFPASYPNPDIISVAATNNRDQIASFSNFGAIRVDVGAPGEQVLTTQVGGGYQLIDGTSFASPYTAGVIGLIASVNQFLTPAELKAALYSSVDVVPGLVGRVATNGRVNAYRALLSAQFAGPIVTAITPGSQTAPVTQIRVSFSKDIDPSFFNVSGITLRRTNSDGRFDSNDIFITIDPSNITLSARELTINLAAPLARDQHRLLLTASNFRDTTLPTGRFLNGDIGTGNDEIYDFNVVAFRGPLEPNDSITQSSPLLLNPQGLVEVQDLVIGDGLNGDRDVDIFRVFSSGPGLITAEIVARGLAVPSDLDSYVRLFDASGVELAANDNFTGLDSKIQFFVAAAGQYYIGVSAFPNAGYNANTENTGASSNQGGIYNILVQVQTTVSEQTTRSNNTTVTIPPTGSITSTIEVTDGRSILDVNARINISHSFVGDLQITLTGPGGQVVTLVNRRGGSGDNFTLTTFDDEAGTSIVAGIAPYSASFRPEVALAAFDSTDAAGTWTLTINDLKAGDAGTLLGWTLDLTVANDIFGPFEVNDTNIVSTDLGIIGAGSRTIDARIGDGAFGLRDVDLFRVNAGSGTTITTLANPTSGSLDTILRLFDSEGNEIAIDKRRGSVASAITYVVADAGIYYIGVSGGNTTSTTDFGNDSYIITTGGSGTVTDATGNYRLTITVAGGISEGPIVLQGGSLGVGINGNGAIGIVTGENPTGLTLDGRDFLLKGGGIDSYFGASLDGFSLLNAADGSQSDVSIAIANESDFANQRVVATGTYRNLGLRRVLAFGANDKYLSIDITLTNRSLAPMNNIAWMEGFNPDQGFNGALPLTRATSNNVLNSTQRLATASFTSGMFPGGLTLGLGAPTTGSGVFMSFETRGTVRDPFQIINSAVDPDPAGDVGVSSDSDMTVAFNVGSLGPNQSATFRYFLFLDTTVGDVLDAYSSLVDGTGGGHLAGDPKSPALDTEGVADLPYRVYYPEGYANSRASTFLPLVNGNSEAIRVVVIARYEGTASFDVLFDSTTDTAGGTIAANKRDGITLTTPANFADGTSDRVKSEVVNATTMVARNGVRKDTPYSIEVRSSAPVGAILSHYDFGISTGDSLTSTLSNTWLLGEGQKGAGISDFVVFYNPSALEVKVTLTAYSSTGGTPFSTFQYVQSHRRGGWAVSDLASLANGNYSFKVEAEAPISVALTHFNTNTNSGYGTIAAAGSGSTTGGSGDGEFGVSSSAEQIAIVNANTTPAEVNFTFSFANGSSFRKQVTLAGQRRGTLELATLVGFPTGQPYTVSYTSNVPVGMNIASSTLGEETGSVFTSQASTQWLFAEGFRPIAGDAVTEYLRLYNPSPLPTTIEITVNFNNGESEVFRRALPSRSGTHINIFELITGTRATVGTVPGVGSFYGLKVQSAVPIVAFAGHFDDFLGGGFGTLGTPLGTTGLVA